MNNTFPISTGQAYISSKNISSELMSLSPSALITLFEIDVGNLGLDAGTINQTDVDLQKNTIFRFHNNINITTNSLFWQGVQFIAAPIIAENFEMNLKGSPAIPTLSITVSDDGIPTLSILKQRIRDLGDLVGAKVSRIRTFARFIDSVNFFNNIPPQNFYPDPTQELPRDVYYVDRLANENKNFIQYELSPLFVTEGITLPARIISQNTCPWLYRAEGCLYEYANRKTSIHGDGTLLQYAPPVATSSNELISSLLTGVPLVDKGEYNPGQSYKIGEFSYLSNKGIKYYFVSKIDNNNTIPTTASGWIEDRCSKNLLGCKLRFQNINSGILNFGGYPSVNRFQ